MNKNNGIHRIPPSELPDDCLKLIFDKLNTKEDRDAFGLTCHNFLDIQNSRRKHLDFKSSYSKNDSPIRCGSKKKHESPIRVFNRFDHFTSLTSCDKLVRLFQRFGHLESLSLTNDDRLLDSSLTKLKVYLCRLHSLDLSGCSYVTDRGLTSVASNCPLLSVILLRDCKLITDKGLNFLTKICKLLKQVDLGGCSNITDIGIGYLNRNCRQLTALRISRCLNLLDVGFLSNIRFLDIVIGDDAIIKIAKGCPLLQEWNLSNCGNINISSWESIGLYCQNLKTVHVNGRYFCIFYKDVRTEPLIALSHCRRLSLIYIYIRWYCEIELRPSEILNEIGRQDVKVMHIFEKDALKKKTISWDSLDLRV